MGLNYNRYVGGVVGDEIKETWAWGLENYTDAEFVAAVRDIIEDVDITAFPSLGLLKARMPKKEKRRPTACRKCLSGVRCNWQDMSDDGDGQGYWRSFSYACQCQAGQEFSALQVWPCDGCVALDEASKISDFRDYPVCRAHDKRRDQVCCETWRRKLAEKTQRKAKTSEVVCIK
ncbi:MAG: hypothetical protein ACYSTI_13105 [Planctomycetota bacterium]